MCTLTNAFIQQDNIVALVKKVCPNRAWTASFRQFFSPYLHLSLWSVSHSLDLTFNKSLSFLY